jgi:hypothetical protein
MTGTVGDADGRRCVCIERGWIAQLMVWWRSARLPTGQAGRGVLAHVRVGALARAGLDVFPIALECVGAGALLASL